MKRRVPRTVPRPTRFSHPSPANPGSLSPVLLMGYGLGFPGTPPWDQSACWSGSQVSEKHFIHEVSRYLRKHAPHSSPPPGVMGRGTELPGPPGAGLPVSPRVWHLAALRTPSSGFHGGLLTQARLIKPSATGDCLNGRPFFPGVGQKEGWTMESSTPLVPWLGLLATSLLPSVTWGFPKVTALTSQRHRYPSPRLGSSRAFRSSVPALDKAQTRIPC